MAQVLDNNIYGSIGEYIKENTKDDSTINISSPIFTIYAFEELMEILEKSGKLNFQFNAPAFIKDIKVNNYEQDFIFNDESLYGDDNDSILADKSVYDYVKYDSDIERAFAEQAETDEDVILYAKLPDSFKIDTPIGTYNPNWALVMNNDSEEKLYFVAETKGTEDINQLRGSEKGKIKCGKLNFEVIDTGIKYEVVKELKTLKNLR